MCVHIPVRVCPCLCLHACVGAGVRMHAHVCVHMPLCVYLHACVHVREREKKKSALNDGGEYVYRTKYGFMLHLLMSVFSHFH